MAMIASRPRRAAILLALLASSAFVCVAPSYAADPDKSVDKIPTESPIKHVIIIVGENRSFDHLFATYVPKGDSERVRNLLSEGIIKADGSPGPNFARAHQFQITAPPNGPGNFFISAGAASKMLYGFLPAPDVRTVHAIHVRAGPEQVLQAAEQLDLESLAVVRALFRLRGWLLRARRLPPHVPRGLVEQLTSMGWRTPTLIDGAGPPLVHTRPASSTRIVWAVVRLPSGSGEF